LKKTKLSNGLGPDDFNKRQNTESNKKIERELKVKKRARNLNRGEIKLYQTKLLRRHEKRQYKKYLGETEP